MCWTASEREIERRIAQARTRLSEVTVPPERLDEIAELCAAARVDGLRADIVIYKTSRAIAAFEGRDAVIPADVQEAQALAHRRPEAHSAPPTGAGTTGAPPSRRPPHEKPPPSSSLSPPGAAQAEPQAADGDGASHAESEPRHFPIGQGVQLSLVRQRVRACEGAVHGKRNAAGSHDRRGAFVRAIMPRPGDPPDLALAATVLAVALDRARVSSYLEVSARH